MLDSEPRNDFSREGVRYQSFNKWPKAGFPTPSLLAGAGFFYEDRGDEVKCFSCHLKVSNWNADMHPANIHKQLNPYCRLVQCNEQTHKPLAYNFDE